MSAPLDWITEDLEPSPVDLCRLAVAIGDVAGEVIAVARRESSGMGEDSRPDLVEETRGLARLVAGYLHHSGIDPVTAIRGAMGGLDLSFCAAADHDQWLGAALFEFGLLAHSMAGVDERTDAPTHLSRLAALTAMWAITSQIRINEKN